MKKSASQIAFTLLILTGIGLSVWLISLVSFRALYIILAVLILLVMVTIHEFGHYLAGKLLKFKINEFAIGFGPKLFSKKRKNGEVFSIRILPLGGFCSFEGEDEIEEQKKQAETKAEPFSEYSKNISITDGNIVYDSNVKSAFVGEPPKEQEQAPIRTDLKRFTEQPPWKRIVVLIAGGAFNLLSAVIFSFIFILVVGYELPKIDYVYEVPSSPGVYYNELKKDDVIVAINGTDIDIMHSYSELLSDTALGEQATLTVLRDGARVNLSITKQTIKTTDDDGNEVEYEGFGFVRTENFVSGDIAQATKYCVQFTGKLAWSILGAFGGLFTGEVKITDLSGPAGTVGTMAEYSEANWRNIFILLPLLAANLGIFNLIPFPALDGSKVIFSIIEWIRKKPINRNVEAYIHLVGMVALLLFVIILDIISFAT